MQKMKTYQSYFILIVVLLLVGCGNRSISKDENTKAGNVGGDIKINTPKAECEALLNSVMPFAEKMLTQHREFYPFGAAMLKDGKITAISSWTEDEQPSSTEVIELLKKGFKSGASKGEYKATVLVCDIRTIPPGSDKKRDAVSVELDHRDNYSAIVIFPYSFSSDSTLRLEQPFALKGENKIFKK